MARPAPGVERTVALVTFLSRHPGRSFGLSELARRLGREPIVAKDSPGFVVNRLARPFYLEAIRLHAEGVPVETVDAALRGAGFRMGPFELLDLIGIDVNLAASESVYRAFYEEPRFRPHPLQRAMVEAGLL
ncbi:MAG: 3-hydroxyacyl-CoA dehydrogenase family protein, partial [Symbiobacteriaceae bacterium]